MVKPELGTKRTCPECAVKFYDLLKVPIVCPMCEFTFVAEPLLPSKNGPAPKPKEVAEPKAVVEEDDDEDDIEVISLEEVDEDDDDDAVDPDVAAVAEIEDVEVDDDDDSKADSDKFLEDDDEDDDVTGILGGVKPGGEDV